MARHGGTIPGKNRAFTTLVDPISPPSTPPPKKRRKMVEAPGTAPGSETLMSRGVYRHSRLPDPTNIGASIGFLKAAGREPFSPWQPCHTTHKVLGQTKEEDE